MPDIRFTYQDPQGQLAALTLLEPTIRAAMTLLSSYLVFDGVADIEILVDQTPTGRFAAGGDSSFVGRFDGIDLWEPSLAAEARTGIDPDPTRADISIYIDPTSSFLSGLWWDPEIAATVASAVPHDRTDAFSVILHELMHGLGIRGWRDAGTGALPADYQSTWDQYISLDGDKAYFGGPATTALLGGPAEVRLGGSQGGYHLGHGPTLAESSQPWIAASLMNGYFTLPGERYLPGRLEIAMLEDLGWLTHASNLVDVVNQLDNGAASGIALALATDNAAIFAFSLYRAAFGRAPDAAGLGFWLAQSGSGASTTEIAQAFITSAEFSAPPDDSAFLQALYANAFARAPDAASLQFWRSALDMGASRADVLAAIAGSAEASAATLPAIDAGIAYIPFTLP